MRPLQILKLLPLYLVALVMATACSNSDSTDSIIEPQPTKKLALALVGDDKSEELIVEGEPTTLLFRVNAEKVPTEPLTLKVVLDTVPDEGFDPALEPVPSEAVILPEQLTFDTEGRRLNFEITLDGDHLSLGTRYHLTLRGEVLEGDAAFQEGMERVSYCVERKRLPRTMRQVVFLEVNNCNPLNILEYRLSDATPFFDAVVLFAANINYNAEEDRVFLNNNPNVQALLDESETYLQPLREAGIKVYLGLLGNHDMAGLAQLSNWGAHIWANEVAEACAEYGLDGVNLDDEYSKEPDPTNHWFTLRSPAAGARLAYELKAALADRCSWPTEVSIFEYGALRNLPMVLADGVQHPQSEFIDFLIPNYGSYSSPYGDLTYAHCCGASIELNHKDILSESYAQGIKEQGFGWCMWFGFDPSGTGGVQSNLKHAMSQFRVAAGVFYNDNLLDPLRCYDKLGEGRFDPNPRAL